MIINERERERKVLANYGEECDEPKNKIYRSKLRNKLIKVTVY